MEKEHVAASIERHVEGVKAEMKIYEVRIQSCLDEIAHWSAVRNELLEGAPTERRLRELYRELTNVIILGAA